MATPAKQLFRPPPSPSRPRHPAASPTYRPRRPTATPLYPVVQHHLETFLAQTTEADPLGNGIPWWVEKEQLPLRVQPIHALVAPAPPVPDQRERLTRAGMEGMRHPEPPL